MTWDYQIISDEIFFRNLEEAIILLTKPAAEQISYIEDHCFSSYDELGLEFDDAIIALPTKLETKSVTQEEYNEIMGLNDLLCAMGGEHNAACWSEEGIKNAAEWQEIREKASSVLSNLNHLWNGIENQ